MNNYITTHNSLYDYYMATCKELEGSDIFHIKLNALVNSIDCYPPLRDEVGEPITRWDPEYMANEKDITTAIRLVYWEVYSPTEATNTPEKVIGFAIDHIKKHIDHALFQYWVTSVLNRGSIASGRQQSLENIVCFYRAILTHFRRL